MTFPFCAILLPSPAFRAKVQGARLSAPAQRRCQEVSERLCCPAPCARHQDERKPQNGSLGLSSALGQTGSLQGLVASSEKAAATLSDNTSSSGDLLPPLLTMQPTVQSAPSLQRTVRLGTPLVTGNSPPPKVARSSSSCSRQFFLVLTQKPSSCLCHGAKPAAPSSGSKAPNNPTMKIPKECLPYALPS